MNTDRHGSTATATASRKGAKGAKGAKDGNGNGNGYFAADSRGFARMNGNGYCNATADQRR
jgi:hypothetical protein